MARKKKTEIIESADIAEMAKNGQLEPVTVKGSHLTVITDNFGKTTLIWDDAALERDVQSALTAYENSVKVNTVETKPKRKKKNEA